MRKSVLYRDGGKVKTATYSHTNILLISILHLQSSKRCTDSTAVEGRAHTSGVNPKIQLTTSIDLGGALIKNSQEWKPSEPNASRSLSRLLCYPRDLRLAGVVCGFCGLPLPYKTMRVHEKCAECGIDGHGLYRRAREAWATGDSAEERREAMAREMAGTPFEGKVRKRKTKRKMFV